MELEQSNQSLVRELSKKFHVSDHFLIIVTDLRREILLANFKESLGSYKRGACTIQDAEKKNFRDLVLILIL